MFVASVVISALIPIFLTIKPLHVPKSRPTTNAPNSPSNTQPVEFEAISATAPHIAVFEPTDKSNPPEIITIVIPTDKIPFIEIWLPILRILFFDKNAEFNVPTTIITRIRIM